MVQDRNLFVQAKELRKPVRFVIDHAPCAAHVDKIKTFLERVTLNHLCERGSRLNFRPQEHAILSAWWWPVFDLVKVSESTSHVVVLTFCGKDDNLPPTGDEIGRESGLTALCRCGDEYVLTLFPLESGEELLEWCVLIQSAPLACSNVLVRNTDHASTQDDGPRSLLQYVPHDDDDGPHALYGYSYDRHIIHSSGGVLYRRSLEIIYIAEIRIPQWFGCLLRTD